MQPTAEEQAWLDKQLATPKMGRQDSPGLTQEERSWLDKQIEKAEADERLDDARQAAYAPGEGSSPVRPKKRS